MVKKKKKKWREDKAGNKYPNLRMEKLTLVSDYPKELPNLKGRKCL